MEDLPKICPRCSTRFAAYASYCPRDGAMLITPHDVDPYLGHTLLGQFHIQEKIGAGGMGTVYRAHQEGVDRDVAIKVLHRELTQNADAVRRFHREAKVSAAIDHPHVVRVILFGQLPDGNLYIVMEYLKGRSLSDELAAAGSLSVGRAMHVMLQVCEGIGAAHSNGVVHRDVKPENVILLERGGDPDFVKVLDFGIARFVTGDQTVVTQTGLIFGTARYISPEGAAGAPTDERSDVYSLAVMAYHLLCGESPFDAPSSVTLLMKHMHEPAPDIRSRAHGSHVPNAVAEVIGRALSKNPLARYANAHAFGDALQEAIAKEKIVMPVMRRPSSMSLSPALPHAKQDSSSITAAEKKSAAVVNPAVQGSYTLANAPNPFSESTDKVQLEALPGVKSSRRVFTMILAFALGALIVFGVYFLASHESSSDEIDALYDRGEAALRASHFVEPENDNVDDITQAILELDPNHEGAKHLREDAASRLHALAEHKRSEHNVQDARAALEQALVFAPHDAELRAELAALSNAPPPESAVGVHTAPESPKAGQAVALLAVVDAAQAPALGTTGTFQVLERGRPVRGAQPATAHQEGRQFLGTYVFPRAGTYEIVFTTHGAGTSSELRATITVAAADARPQNPTPRSNSTSQDPPVVTHDFRNDTSSGPTTLPPANDTNINWGSPSTNPRPNNPAPAPTPESSDTPPPWNG